MGVLVALGCRLLPHCKSFLKEDPRPQRLCADAERKRTRNEESSWSNRGHGQLTAGPSAFCGDSGHRVQLTAHRWRHTFLGVPIHGSHRHLLSQPLHLPWYSSCAFVFFVLFLRGEMVQWRDEQEINHTSVITRCPFAVLLLLRTQIGVSQWRI